MTHLITQVVIVVTYDWNPEISANQLGIGSREKDTTSSEMVRRTIIDDMDGKVEGPSAGKKLFSHEIPVLNERDIACSLICCVDC